MSGAHYSTPEWVASAMRLNKQGMEGIYEKYERYAVDKRNEGDEESSEYEEYDDDDDDDDDDDEGGEEEHVSSEATQSMDFKWTKSGNEGVLPTYDKVERHSIEDEEDDDEDEEADDRLPKPAPAGRTDIDQGTFGVELEFLVVQCPKGNSRRVPFSQDTHPEDGRWLSKYMTAWDIETLATVKLCRLRGTDLIHDIYEDLFFKFCRYSRTKLTRVLRDAGLTVIKWPEMNINPAEEHMDFVPINDFEESEPSDDEREDNYANASRLGNFTSTYTWDPEIDRDDNLELAIDQCETDMVGYHQQNALKLYRTRDEEIRDFIVARFNLLGWPPETIDQDRRWLERLMTRRLQRHRDSAKQRREDVRNQQVDPLHVSVPGIKPQYRAWTVTIDYSVDGNGMTAARYIIPPDKLTDSPFLEYHWFGAEVVSPVLPTGDERSREAIRRACGSLRDALRIHKPMEVSTGLHIHLGHSKGWTLYQLKRFATFWFLAEETILQLHRIDRGMDRKWCAKIGDRSRLWLAMFSNEFFGDLSLRRRYASAMETNHSEATKEAYWTELCANVPVRSIPDDQVEFIYYIWQLSSINNLNFALGENAQCRTGLKWRVRGQVNSMEAPLNPDKQVQPGTVEVRIMQGTLDADHINNWTIVLEQVVDMVRNLPDREFQQLLKDFVEDKSRNKLLYLLEVPDEVRLWWQSPKRRDEHDAWFEYPDQDLVDWGQPFMVPGHRATHGAYWD
ncbi:hypothetical protein F5Y19DRAFT_476629 [Xylariaceae sp. FL1651]|nr:hypothetical protein F5Y19DRAFT_476629 [Xylariaceae sp. FL1651]